MKKLILFSIVFFPVFGICQLQKVMVNVYTPAKIMFPPDVKSIMVTSRFVPATGLYEDLQWGAYESVDSIKWALSESVIDTLAKRLAVTKSFMVKLKHYPRMLRHNAPNLPDLLPWLGLSELSKKESVQAFLIMEGFGLDRTPLAIDEVSGKFNAHYSIAVTIAIRVYEPDKMRMIDDSVYTFSTEIKGLGFNAKEAQLQLPGEGKALILACSNAADSYFNLIKPGEKIEKRFYYPKGDSSMIKADQAIKESKWGRAESKWKWLAYNSKDSVIQAKASYNMAVACERDGRFNQAIGFARRSDRLNPGKPTKDYINLLNDKILYYENQVQLKKIIKRW